MRPNSRRDAPLPVSTRPALLTLLVALAAPVGAAAADAAPLIPESVDLSQGKAVYELGCGACHGRGLAGAPRPGDRAAWAPRIERGWDTLVEHALRGFKGMPPKGGRFDLPERQIINAVGFMLDTVQSNGRQ